MQLQAAEAEFVLDQVVPDEEAQAAQQDEADGHQVDQRIGNEGFQRGERPGDRAHQVKARVAERGDGVKHRIEDAAAGAEQRDKAQGKQQRAGELQQHGAQQRAAHEAHDAADVQGGDALHQQRALAKADAPVHHHRRQRDDRHHAQTADLDAGKEHAAAEDGPVARRIHDDQTGDADGARGREQRGERVGPCACTAGGREHQQQGDERDDRGEAQCDDALRAHRRMLGKGFVPAVHASHLLMPFKDTHIVYARRMSVKPVRS